MPLDVSSGDRVLAATMAIGGTLCVRTERVGEDTTFGRVLRLVEEAETHASRYQRLADRVATSWDPETRSRSYEGGLDGHLGQSAALLR